MKPLLLALAVSLMLEWSLTLRPCWPARRWLAIVSLVCGSFAAAGLLGYDFGTASLIIAVAAMYRSINMARVLEGRLHEMNARHAVRQTTLWLGGVQLPAVLTLLLNGVPTSWSGLLVLLAVAQLAAATTVWLTVRRQLRTTGANGSKPAPADNRLPSLTVAVAARNEDAQLEECLTSLLASDYTKLEIIVLDDCSHDRTPDIIRSFAHAGVRFIRGREPDDDWLARNLAYDRLAGEASGALILFCGVDVRVGRTTLRQLVTTLQERNKTMLSVLPLNPGPTRLPLVQAMRYFWEMAPPRRLFNRPPVLSTCWLITRDSLRAAGGFAAVRRSVTPEAHFAKAALGHDGYAFIRSDAALGVSSEKSSTAQRDTAIQTRYPQLHRRPEMVLLVAAAELLLLLAPLPVALYGLLFENAVAGLIAAAAVVLLAHGFARLQTGAFVGVSVARAAIASLPAIALDLWVLHVSLYRFEFGSVLWRERDICYPVMHRQARAAHPERPTGRRT